MEYARWIGITICVGMLSASIVWGDDIKHLWEPKVITKVEYQTKIEYRDKIIKPNCPSVKPKTTCPSIEYVNAIRTIWNAPGGSKVYTCYETRVKLTNAGLRRR